MCRICIPTAALSLPQYIQAWTGPALLAASSLLALASSFTLFTALRLLVENMHLPFSTANLWFGLIHFGVAIWGVFVSPLLDRTPLLPLGLGAILLSVGLRVAMAALVFANNTQWMDWTILPLLTLITACDGIAMRTMDLQLKHTADGVQLLAQSGETTLATRLFSFQYSLVNIAVFAGTGIYDAARTYLPSIAGANMFVQILGALTAVLASLCLFVAHTLHTNASPARHFPIAPRADDVAESPVFCWAEFRPLLTDITLWRFTFFSLCLSGARSIMAHMENTMPEIMGRLYGPTVHFAALQAINPLLVFVAAPLVQHWTVAANGYWIIVMGCLVTSLSVLPLVIVPPALLDVGATSWIQKYVPYIAFVTLFSIGEALWSARLQSYALSVAPRERRASYLALAGVPLIGVRLLAAWHSGVLIDQLCPEAGSLCRTQLLWLVVFLFGALTPLILGVFSRWLNPDRRRQQQLLLLQNDGSD